MIVHRPHPHYQAGTILGRDPWTVPGDAPPWKRTKVACGRPKPEVTWTINPALVTCPKCRRLTIAAF